MSDFTFTVRGRVFEHNTSRWRVCTNRHTTTGGRNWGWIEGAPGNICWSNDSEVFDHGAALEAVNCHNEWVENQKPLVFRLIEARAAVRKAISAEADAYQAYEKAKRRMIEAGALVAALEREFEVAP